MANSAQVTVTTTATKLAAPGVGSGNVKGDTLLLFNAGASTVLLGGEDLTTGNGFGGLVAGATVGLDVNEDVYGIVASGTCAVHVLRVK